MSRAIPAVLLCAVLFPISLNATQFEDPGLLYARITTLRGEQVEGFLRWDNNEGHWMDVLDASKRIPSRYLEEAGRGESRTRSSRFFGIRVNFRRSEGPTRQSGIRMGHIRTIEVLDGRHALLTLKSGEEQEFERSSTDLGNTIQGIELHPLNSRVRTFDWDEIDFIEFAPAPMGLESPMGSRLYGTLELSSGAEFTGWITWDMDEIFTGDELDGDSGGKRHSIAFGEIDMIERTRSDRALVTLKTGEQLTLRGTNDVNSGNRGILVGDPGLGQIRTSWRRFAKVKFQALPGAPGYPEFTTEARLNATVHRTDGTSQSGVIRWDNDEAFSWEFLDGEMDGIEFKIEFGMIAAIERLEKQGARVTLRDGRSYELDGSNDVGSGNNGVFVTIRQGEGMLIPWRDVERVVFEH